MAKEENYIFQERKLIYSHVTKKKNQYFEMGRMQNEVSICKRTPGTRLMGGGGGCGAVGVASVRREFVWNWSSKVIGVEEFRT